MAGAALQNYLDLSNRTGGAIFSGKQEIVNDAVKQTYGISPFMKGKGIAEMFRGGTSIKDEWFPDEQSTAVTHLPGAEFTWSNPQTSKYWTANYRYLMDHMSVIEQEDMLNGPEQMSGLGRFQQIKDMMFGKKQRLMTSIYNKMDNLFFAEPDFNNMESATGTEPYSYAALVNEQTNGLFNPTGTPATVGTVWTTVEGINPTSAGNSKWVPQRVSYLNGSTTAAANDVPSAFHQMMYQIQFVPPTSYQEYFERDETDRIFIATSLKGITHYTNCLANRQDLLLGNRQDFAFPNPSYKGIPLKYWKGLDTATWYPNHLTAASATDNVTEGATTANGALGPRYYWTHPKYLLPIFHERRYVFFRPATTPPNQPEATIIPVSTWYNFIIRSRQRQGVVYPGANTAGMTNPFSAY